MSDRMLSDEILLGIINSKSGGGGGGTSNYNDLSNKPQIGGVTLSGNKSASDLGLVAAETGKGLSTNDYTDADKAIVGGVTAALAGKQDVLTAGNYVSITNDGTINVTQSIGVYDVYSYEVMSTGVGITIQLTKKINNVTISTQDIRNEDYSPTNKLTVDGLFELWYDMSNFYWHYKLLVDSEEHQKNEDISWYYRTMADYTETFNVSQDSSTDLATKGDVNAAINAIKDGTSIDSFADVETALALKQDKNDNSLQTTDKTVVGAVNELKSGLTNYEATTNAALALPTNTGKNVFPVTLALLKGSNTDGTWSGNDYTISGVTFACAFNSDGYLTSITANGTSTAYIYFRFYQRTINPLHLYGSFIVSGGLNDNAIFVVGRTYNGAWQVLGASKGGDSNPFTVALSDDIGANIEADNGTEFTNAMFYPMIRPATITDATFAPYIPSVESRIEAVESGLNEVNSNITTLLTSYSTTSLTGVKYVKLGKLVCVTIDDAELSSTTALGIPTSNNNIVLTLRDQTVGGIVTVVMSSNATIASAAGNTNFVAGHKYAGSFAYLSND